jgi:hypothetical protein
MTTYLSFDLLLLAFLLLGPILLNLSLVILVALVLSLFLHHQWNTLRVNMDVKIVV